MATSCHDGTWDAPSADEGMAAYGNPSIKDSNVKTIAEVKALFAEEISSGSLKQVTEPMQIKGIVVGNDEGGNIYNSIYIQDQTGAMAISIGQSGLYGAFSVGQCVLIELNGLYVGGYGKQPQIGTTYTNPNKEGDTPQVGRMTRYMWQEHYKLIPAIEGLAATPTVVKWNFNSLDIAKDCGKLITLKGVELPDADGKAVFAPSDGSVTLTANCANRTIKGLSDVVLRTSTFADFANQVLPSGRVDITGVATRYNDTWQILMRTPSDIQPTTLADDDVPPTAQPSGSGTAADPYNVQGIIEAMKDLTSGTTTDKEYYVHGYITKVGGFNDKYSNISYFISDDKEGNMNSFYVYGGLGLNKAKFSSVDDLKVGDEVTICGKITNYNGTIEFQNSNYLVSHNGNGSGGDDNGDDNGGDSGEATGDGTLENPFNALAAIAYAQSVGEQESDKEVYIKGKVAAITEQYGATQYGNATFTISDDGKAVNTFTVYRALYLGNVKYTEGDLLYEGDDVVICGKVTNFKGNTPETVTGKAYLYSLNGETE